MRHDFSAIEGEEVLRAIFGEDLCFHDSEVIRLELVRGRTDQGEANLIADIHLFRVEGVAPGTDRFTFGRHHVARLLFEGVQEVELEGFNHQNALMDLAIVALEPPVNGARYGVTFNPAFGVGAKFNCFRVALASVQPGLPAGSSYV